MSTASWESDFHYTTAREQGNMSVSAARYVCELLAISLGYEDDAPASSSLKACKVLGFWRFSCLF